MLCLRLSRKNKKKNLLEPENSFKVEMITTKTFKKGTKNSKSLLYTLITTYIHKHASIFFCKKKKIDFRERIFLYPFFRETKDDDPFFKEGRPCLYFYLKRKLPPQQY